MVICFDSSRTYRSNRLVYLQAGSAKPIFTCRRDPADQAEHSLDGKLDNSRSQTNGKGHEPAKYSPFLHDLPTPTSGTLKGPGVLTDSKDCPSLLETSMNVMHSSSCDPETMIDYARGHGLPRLLRFF